jgi:hypothetical protein
MSRGLRRRPEAPLMPSLGDAIYELKLHTAWDSARLQCP